MNKKKFLFLVAAIVIGFTVGFFLGAEDNPPETASQDVATEALETPTSTSTTVDPDIKTAAPNKPADDKNVSSSTTKPRPTLRSNMKKIPREALKLSPDQLKRIRERIDQRNAKKGEPSNSTP